MITRGAPLALLATTRAPPSSLCDRAQGLEFFIISANTAFVLVVVVNIYLRVPGRRFFLVNCERQADLTSERILFKAPLSVHKGANL
jgi:hypothetical protein